MAEKGFPWGPVLTAGGALASFLSLLALAEKRPPKPIGRVALIGDSYAVGLGPPLALLLPDFQYEGHVGSNTWQWAHMRGCGRCGEWLSEYKPKLVLVSLGTNDGDAPNRENYQAIVQRIHGIGSQVVWLQPPRGVVTPSRAIIASLGIRTIPAPATQLSPDGLHPVSYEPWAREIAGAIAN